jgi:hypothetical protein
VLKIVTPIPVRAKIARLPDTHLKFQSPGHKRALTPLVLHRNRNAIEPPIFYLDHAASVQALVPRVFHLNRLAIGKALQPRIFHLGRDDFAPMFFHLDYLVFGQPVAFDRFFSEIGSCLRI